MAISSQTLKNLGKSVAYSSIDVLSKLTPNTTELVRASKSSADSLRDFARTQQTKLTAMSAQMDRSKAGRNARAFLMDAWNDVKKGNLSLGNLADDSFDDWEKYLNDENTGSDITSFSNQKVQDEEGVNNQATPASSAKVPLGTDYRTLEGLQQLGNTLGKATIKSAQYQTGLLMNAINLQTSMQNEHFTRIEKQLDAINKNVIQLVNFQSKNQGIINQAQMRFFDQMSDYVKKQEERAKRMASLTDRRRPNKVSRFLSDNFFDMGAYKDIVKNNFENSQFGMMASMLGIMDPSMIGMMLSGPRGKIQPQRLLLNGILSALIPRSARNAIRQGDSMVNTILKTGLQRLGRYQYDMDKHPILGLIGSILGIDSSTRRTVRLGQFKRGEMSWNGEAQKALVQVIPKELAEIKAAILKQEAKYFDMQTGTYMSTQDIRRRTKTRMQDATEVPFANIFNSISMNPNDARNKKYWEGMTKELQDQVSKIVNQAVMGEGGLTEALSNALDETLGKGVKKQGGTRTDTVRMATRLTDAINQSRANMEAIIKDLQEQNSAFAQVASNMANSYGMIDFSSLQDFIGGTGVDLRAANSGRYTYSGKRKEAMSSDERRRYEQNERAFNKARDKLKNLKNSKNRFARAAGTIGERYYNRKMGIDESGYSRAFREGAENIFNAMYDVFQLGKNPFKAGSNQDMSSAERAEMRRAATTSRSKSTNRQRGGRRVKLRSTARSSVNTNEDGDDDGDAPGSRGGGIVNLSTIENSASAKNDPQRQTAKAVTSTDETMTKAFDPEKGYMAKIFNSPVMQKFIEWLKNSKLGKAISSGIDKGKAYVKSIFTEDYIDDEGNRVDSVKTRFSKGFNKAKETVLAKLGIKPNGQVDTEDESTVTGATAKAAESIGEMTEAMTGEKGGGGKKSASAIKQKVNSILKELNKVIRKHAPKVLTGGIAGAALGALSGGSTGLLGGLFLPGGPIGGAVIGMGLSILSQTDTFKNIVFGKQDKDGNRQGGILSTKMVDGFKKLLPTLGIGAGVGVILKLLTGAIGGPVGTVANVMGFFPSLFLPGGVMGAAIMGAAGAFALRNQKIQDIIFGEKDEDGKRTGSLLSGLYNKFTGKINGENAASKKGISKKLLTALKGAGMGLLASATIGKMGILGSTLTFGGPIGSAIAGAALSILATGKKFDEYLYGKEGADGKRKKTGLFSRIGKALELNFIEPISSYVMSTTEQLAWWAKEKVEVPFRMALGPIIDGFKNMGDSMKETTKGVIEKAGEKLQKGIDKILSPVGNFLMKHVLSPIGHLAGSLIKTGLFAGTSIIGAPFQLLSLAMSGKRRKGNKLFGNFLRENREENLQSWWDAQEAETGKKRSWAQKLGDRARYGMGSSRIFGSLFRSDEMFGQFAEAFGETEEGKNRNNMDWLGAAADRTRYKKNRKAAAKDFKNERKIRHLRRTFAGRDKYMEDADLDDKEVQKRIKRAKKLGIDLKDADELREFTYNYKDWKKTPEEKAAAKEANAAVVKLDSATQETMNAGNKTANETRDLVKSIRDLFTQALTKLGIIADNSQAQTDIQTGSSLDTEDVDNGDVSETIDSEMADKIQTNQAKKNAAAIGGVISDAIKKKEKKEKNAQVTGNESGAADDKSTDFDYTNRKKDEDEAAVKVDDDGKVTETKSSGGLFSGLGSGLLGTLGSVVKGVLTSKAGLIGLLGAGLAAVLANPELRTMIGNMLGEVGSWLWGKIKEGFSNLPDLISGAWNTLTGQNGGVNQSRALAYDEEGNVTEYVDNTGLKEAVVTAGVANTAQGFRGVSRAVSKAAKKGKSLNIVQKIGQFIKSTSLPGHKVVGNTVKGAGTIGGGIINGVKKLFGIGKNNQAGGAAAAAAGAVDDAVDITGAASKVAGEAAEGAADAAAGKGGTSFIKKIANKLLGKTDDAAAAAAGAAGKTTTLGGMVKNLVQKGANKLAQTDLGQTLISNAKVLGATAKDNVQSIATKGLDALKGLGSKAVEGVKSIGSKVAGLFKGGADNVAGAAAKAATGAADDVAKAATKSATSNASIVTKALDLIKKGLESAGKSKLGSKFSKVLSTVAKFFDDIIKAVTKKGVASKLISKLCGALASAGAKVASYLVPGVNIMNAVLAAGSAISGALQPERLFKIDDKYVDGKMRTIAAVINGITSATGLGSVLSVINEIWTEISGDDFIQGFAITIYHAFADDEDDVKIETAVKEMEQEVANYNEANGTNLSVDAYNDKKNKGFWGGLWNSVQGLWGGGDRTDYSQYEVGNYKGSSSVGNGAGSKKASKNNQIVGYGFGLQTDPRWASMKLGKFTDGSDSTMATGGCGPTALSNAANALGLGYNPVDVAMMASNHGYLAQGGSSAKLFESGADTMGLTGSKIRTSSQLVSSLKAKQPVVLAGKSAGYGASTPYTSAGHIVTATGLDDHGNVVVQDPMNGTSLYKPDQLSNGMTHGWSYKRRSARKKAIGYGIIDGLFGSALSTLATGAGASLLSKLTGIDYATAKSQLAANASDTTDDNSNVNAGSVPSVGSVPNDASSIYNFLLNQGFTKNAAAGIMGCWQIESSNRSDRVEGDYLSGFPGFQKVLESNQSLNDYTQNFLFPAYERSNISINKNGYKGTDGNYYPGIGLAQWTGPRGYSLFSYAKQNNADWRDTATQLGYFMTEAQSRNLLNIMNAATSPEDGARLALDHYEMYEGYSNKAPSALAKRVEAAKQVASKFGSSTNIGNGRGPLGYGILDTLFSPFADKLASAAYSAFGLTYDGGNSSSGSSGSGSTTGVTYPAVVGDTAATQQNLVKQMASLIDPATGEGTIDYSQEWNEQDPDKGKASCASTVAWAYNKVLGFKPGGSSGFARSTEQAKDENFKTIYVNDGNTLVDLKQLQPGDIVYQNWDRTSNNGQMQHTEMYAGNAQDLSHGGNPRFGPAYKNFGDYRKKHTMMVRRYKGFIPVSEGGTYTGAGFDGTATSRNTGGRGFTSDGRGGGFGTSNSGGGGFGGNVGNGIGIGFGTGPNAGAFSINRVGQYQHRNDIPTGYGPGTTATTYMPSNHGVESRLDSIINLMRLWYEKMTTKSATSSIGNGPGSSNVNVTNNNYKEAPTVVVNQNMSKNLGAKDAAHEYLRNQHRKLASVPRN